MRKQLLLGFLAMVLLLFPAHALGTPAEGDTSARSAALSVLEAAFPNESWTDCNPLAWDAAAQDGKQIAAAIIDRAGSRVFYMVDGLAPQTAKVRNAALIPAEAEEGSLHVNCQLLHGQYDVGYIYFELDGVSYTAELSRSDAGVCQLKSIGIYSGSETNDAYWTAVPQGALLTLDTGDFSQAMCIRAPLPDCMPSALPSLSCDCAPPFPTFLRFLTFLTLPWDSGAFSTGWLPAMTYACWTGSPTGTVIHRKI